MPSNFCPSCGAPRQPTVRFCGSCGASFDASTASAVTAAGATSAPLAPHGWHVVVGDALPTFAAVASAGGGAQAAGIVAHAMPKSASIRGQVLQLLVVTAADWVAARATRDPAAMKLADLRAGLAIVAAIAGIISGRSRGFFSKITMFSALGLAVAQSPSLYSFAQRIISNPSLLAPLLPNYATQGLSFLAAIRTALSSRK